MDALFGEYGADDAPELKVSNVAFDFPSVESLWEKQRKRKTHARKRKKYSASQERDSSSGPSELKPPSWKKAKVNHAELLRVGMWAFNVESLDMWFSSEMIRIFELEQKTNESEFSCFKRYIHQDDRDLFLFLFERATDKGVPYQITHRLCTSKGEVKWCRTTCYVSENDQEHLSPSKLCGTTQDITLLPRDINRGKQKAVHMCFDGDKNNFVSECPIV
ncbi:hypothetical protein AAMO2058_000498000 [Amorphochlora amoebiformis]|eukprot:1395159-Amorphochlora_amoeboformis.AAC.1